MRRIVVFPVFMVQAWQRAGYQRASGRHYTKAATKRIEEAVKDAYISESMLCYGEVPFAPKGTPVKAEVHVYRALPASRPKRVESEPDTAKSGGGGDADNFAKAVLDGLNGVAYDDDSQVTVLYVEKHDRVRGAEERTEVAVSWEEEA